uniref:2-amino-4-hydroxy-6-hydroxymethyldihydropteridine diphosphokinase n=1 Tax=uncultured Chloroflexota bacterium TaxID=166587 RepID=H5S993_9CHLR|nr:2-amino-4-hydroxy-6-hydroxymethyldihydropteridine pyrophosphokinase [uncultured Chloroflexota bacterium]
MHQVYLSLGSNIEPEKNLPRALHLLRQKTQVALVSHVWQSRAVGSDGPDFLNACVQVITPLSAQEFKEQVIQAIEGVLGRKRMADKFAPRTIDVDILFYDGEPFGELPLHAFIVVPLAEIAPDLRHPLAGEHSMAALADRLRSQTWIVPRLDVKLE